MGQLKILQKDHHRASNPRWGEGRWVRKPPGGDFSSRGIERGVSGAAGAAAGGTVSAALKYHCAIPLVDLRTGLS